MKPAIVRPLQLTTAGFVLLLIAAFVLLGLLALRSEARIERVQRGLASVRGVRSVCRRLDEALVAQQAGTASVLAPARESLGGLLHRGGFESPASAERLSEARQLLSQPMPDPAEALGEALLRCRAAVDGEDRQLAEQVAQLTVDTKRELSLGLVALLVLLGLVGAILLFVRLRVQKPLRALAALVSRLSEGELTPVPLRRRDPLVQPLFDNYNRLVERLEELEAEHERHAGSLASEVRAATRALLEQHKSLARADRLAATGELAASVAHEVRNPLAGMQVTLSNLQQEVSDPEMVERLSLVIDEVTRLSRLLDGLLSNARHTPERPKRLVLGRLVDRLLALVRYQVPPGIELRNEVPSELACCLPEDRLRQGLLNLILNAAEAMPDDGRGLITVGAERRGTELAIFVRDDGPGFPPEVLEGPVSPFATRRAGGMGLGLAMVKRFARDLDGRLELANRPPRGGEITMLLPDVQAHA